MQEMRGRALRITQDLNALLEELAAVREEHATELVTEVLTLEVIKGFRSSVHSMRRLLWLYIDAASRQSNLTSPNETLREAIDALRSMHESGNAPLHDSPGDTLIEKVEAIVEKKIPSLHKD